MIQAQRNLGLHKQGSVLEIKYKVKYSITYNRLYIFNDIAMKIIIETIAFTKFLETNLKLFL